ncbi:PadR family transcriptional regulator [Crocosphaera sp.]|uniref:PadR family transcriptional regulator n=1 Tax=Crocosphaera sp. TaxID=2729996 RepID=UPI00261075E2|nr:PadR family transcriptional regulator [Crocosphaera sp.]MDJ0578801.1 PadR family transcriptional regulator [Crocosphaera sp.]
MIKTEEKAMALTHTILVTIATEPHTGYEIWKNFEETLNCFWKASQQQIYRELGKMEQKGLVNSEMIFQQGRPNKKLYSITEQGKIELEKWISFPSEPTVIREDLLVKIRAGSLVNPEIILQELKHRRQIHQETLTRYQQKEKDYLKNIDSLTPSDYCLYLTLKRGIIYENEWIEWCDEALEYFSSLKLDS